ncbi:MAG: hypothetical protein O3C40_27710 [Planctomycetota bacterium]|nr:hypothetical protein [Planctomycetota bacterium]
MNAEQQRLVEDRDGKRPWRKLGPYLSEHQWGTVREDYSAHGEAWLLVNGISEEAKNEARRRFLGPLETNMEQAGLGHISEICDAEPPHTPRGCPFQAWSLGEYLRLKHIVLEDVDTKSSNSESSR